MDGRQDNPPVVAVWGLAYKQDTHSVKNSPSLALLSALTGMHVQAYDPQVKLDGLPGVHFQQAGSALDACDGADVLVVMTPWSEFRTVDLAQLAGRLRQPRVIDPFGCLDAAGRPNLAWRISNSVSRLPLNLPSLPGNRPG